MVNNNDGKTTVRYDTATNWSNANPILAKGEIGVESDTNLLKVGDGVKRWSELTNVIALKTKGFSYKGVIPNGADLNDYNDGGIYVQTASANTTNIKNRPTGMNSAFMLLSFDFFHSVQVLIRYEGNEIYIRHYENWGTAGWKPWYKYTGVAVQ